MHAAVTLDKQNQSVLNIQPSYIAVTLLYIIQYVKQAKMSA